MLEPLIVLTVLNCIFMFSSTVTTCALWWQYQGHRCCARKAPQSRADLKRSKSYMLRTVKKSEKSNGNGDVNVVRNSNRNGNRERRSKKCQKKRSKKSLRYAEYQKKNEEKMSLPIEAKRLDAKTKMSEASQTINDTKSTVVMEFSTVQKVVQIVDDSDVNSTRPPFKDIIQKNMTDRKRDYNVEQNFESNLAAPENP